MTIPDVPGGQLRRRVARRQPEPVMTNPLKGRPYRRRRAAILASATVCGICLQAQCPHCAGDVCGSRLNHLDHDTPRSKGGALAAANEQAAHQCCNLKKGNRDTVEILQTSRPW